MVKIKNFVDPTKGWMSTLQFGTLGIVGGTALVFFNSVGVGLAIAIASFTIGYYTDQQQHDNNYATSKRAYLSYLIKFETEDIVEAINSTVSNKATKVILKEFLLEYRKYQA